MRYENLPHATAFILLDHIRNDEELEAYVQARVADAVEQAVARERERCAAICDGLADSADAVDGRARASFYRTAAHAIRTTNPTTGGPN
jgi:hypothetical protein